MTRSSKSKDQVPSITAPLQVVHFQRRQTGAQVSIERLFHQIREASPPDICFRSHVSPHRSRGVLPRLWNLLAARNNAGSVNHIVGDVHYLAASLPGPRTVLTIHDCAPLYRLTGLRRKLLCFFWFEWPARRVSVITAISESTRQELFRWLPLSLHSKIKVIHNCVRAEFQFRPKPFNCNRPVVLQVGTGWNKNLDRVAQALAGTPCCLEIVGPLHEDQHKMLRQCGVDYVALGKLNDAELLAAYGRCDFLVFASLYEGFGLPILEAQAVGRPVITSSRGPMPEVAGEGGALFIDPENVSSLKAALENLIRDERLRNSLVESGVANVQRFQPKAIAAQYAAIYRKVASSPEVSNHVGSGV